MTVLLIVLCTWLTCAAFFALGAVWSSLNAERREAEAYLRGLEWRHRAALGRLDREEAA